MVKLPLTLLVRPQFDESTNIWACKKKIQRTHGGMGLKLNNRIFNEGTSTWYMKTLGSKCNEC